MLCHGTYDVATFGWPSPIKVTAVRSKEGDLKVIVWNINVSNNGSSSITRISDMKLSAVSEIAVSHARAFNGFYTAVRDGAGKLKVIPFKVSSNGSNITHGISGTVGKISGDLDVAPLAAGVAAAVRDSEGNLTMITWASSASGNIQKRSATYRAGAISEIELTTMPNGDSNLTSVVRDSGGSAIIIG